MTGARRDDADLPIIDAVEPFGAELVDTGSTGSGRSPRGGEEPRTSRPRLGPRQGAGVAAAALALLVIGIAVGGFSLAPEPTATPSDAALRTPATSPGASASADVDCRAPRPGQLPAVTMTSTDSRRVLNGLFTYGSGHGSTDAVHAWRIPLLAAAARPSAGARLEFLAGERTCFRHVLVEYAATASVPDGPVRVWFDASRPPTPLIAVDLPPEGDWVVRVTAQFEAPDQTSPAGIVTVTDFRVIVGNGPVVTDPPVVATFPSPERTPTVPCGTSIPSADVGVELIVSNGTVVPGSADEGSQMPEVHMRPGDTAQIVVDGEICATQWQMEVYDFAKDQSTLFDNYWGQVDDLSVAAENRWSVPAIYGEAIVTANLDFPGGLQIARNWRIVVDQFVAPSLFLVGSDGARFEATVGCSLDVHLSNGYGYQDGCQTAGYTEDPDALAVAALSVIHLDLPDWAITGWSATCGRMSADGLNYEADGGGCGLGAGSSDTDGAVPQPPAFILHAGDHVVQIAIWATDADGNAFNAEYYAHVVAR